MKLAQSNEELGYFSEEGDPTDAQLELQDEIDNTVSEFFNSMIDIYNRAGETTIAEFEHDIQKITEVREETEKLLGLPDIY